VRAVPDLGRRPTLLLLAAITAIGAAFRFYGLSWGAPYYHFHIDEHFVLAPADLLRRNPDEAAMAPKFFMYSPLTMYVINFMRGAYEALAHPLDLTAPRDQTTYMTLGRAVSASFGVATIVLVYAVAKHLQGRLAGLLGAFFLACAVLHIQESHFATTNLPMTFFCVVALWFSIRIAERGDLMSLVGAGFAFGAAILAKYTGAFTLGVIGFAYLLAPTRPRSLKPVAAWLTWAARGIIPIVVGVATFLALDPLVLRHRAKFLSDIKEQVTDPLTGVTKPIWIGNFADLRFPQFYWFTNLLPWGLGPLLALLGLAGVVWLLMRRDKAAAVVAIFPIVYFAAAGRTIAPFIRYAIPLVPAMALTAGILSAAWLRRSPNRLLPRVIVGGAVLTTFLYALAFMNVYRQPDARLQASQWLIENVPPDSKILIEPSQNTPPIGAYLTATNFYHDYVLWGGTQVSQARRERRDYYHLFTFDVYQYLYASRHPDDAKRAYIASRLAEVDWIVIDDTYVQWYQHLPVPENGVVRQYYQDLFDGKLGFARVKTFKVYPELFGLTINDDSAEQTFRHFDHPRVFIFRRFKNG
jgi:hypothetical protein